MTRKILTLLLSAFCILGLQAAEKAVKSKIKHVTVFLNGAQVTRDFSAKLITGTQTITLKDLSPYLDAKTIQLKGNGDFTILSLQHKINYLDEKEIEGDLKMITDSLNFYQRKYSATNTEVLALNESESFLKTNKQIKGQENLDVATLKGVHDFYYQKLLSIHRTRNDLNYELVDINKTMSRFRNQLHEVNKRLTKSTSEILIELQSQKAITGEFQLSYLVNHASWYPSYDIRVQDINRPLELVYKANVRQNTGEDWDDVYLTFSNANPYQSGDLPVLKPYYLNYTNGSYSRNPYQNTSAQNSYNLSNYISSNNNEARGRVVDDKGNPVPYATIRVQGTAIGTYTDESGNFSIALPQGKSQVKVQYIGYREKYQNLNPNAANNIIMQASQESLAEVMITSYDKAEVNKMPTRSMNNIATTSAGVSYGWSFGGRKKYDSKSITVTPLENQTSLEISLDIPFTIKQGGRSRIIAINNASVPAYYEHRSVPKLEKAAFLIARIVDWSEYNLLEGEANLYFENTFIGKSILDVRFLTDTLNISLGRDKGVLVNRQKVKSQTSREFIGKETIEKRQFEIKVRNNKKQPINLIVYDQVPISQRPKDIDVTLKDKSGAVYNEQTGELKWVFKLDQAKTKEMGIRYQVKFPKGKNINLE